MTKPTPEEILFARRIAQVSGMRRLSDEEIEYVVEEIRRRGLKESSLNKPSPEATRAAKQIRAYLITGKHWMTPEGEEHIAKIIDKALGPYRSGIGK